MDPSDLRAFVRIADLGSVSGAARALGVPKSSVSRSLARLEAAVGSVLVERSTRSLRLTDAGRLLRPYALCILDDMDEAREALDQFAGAPRGTLRVNAPYTFALGALAPMLPGFLQRYPEVAVVLELESGQTGRLAGEADLFIRLGPLPDTALVARRLTTVELWACASPAYLAARGVPSCVADLAGHEIVDHVDREVAWSFRDPDGRAEEVRLHPRAVVPDVALIRAAIAAGAGIGQLPDFMAADAIAKGELRRVLPHMGPATGEAHALYPSRRGLSAKVRVFLDALVVRMAAQRAAFEALDV